MGFFVFFFLYKKKLCYQTVKYLNSCKFVQYNKRQTTVAMELRYSICTMAAILTLHFLAHLTLNLQCLCFLLTLVTSSVTTSLILQVIAWAFANWLVYQIASKYKQYQLLLLWLLKGVAVSTWSYPRELYFTNNCSSCWFWKLVTLLLDRSKEMRCYPLVIFWIISISKWGQFTTHVS